MGVENYIFWSEIRSGFEEQGGTPHQEFPGVGPPPPTPRACSHEQKLQKKVTLQLLEDLVGLVGKTMNKQS